MITIKIMTVFPEFYNEFLKSSIIGRAISRELVQFKIINIRDYSLDKNHRVDDHPIGGGAGLVMRMEPLMDCLRANTTKYSYKILMGPKGKRFTQSDARYLSKRSDIVLICGHYEGVDSRFEDYVDAQYSIGDFILTGGEIPAMAMADSIVRLLPGAIADDSTKEESFNDGLLEYPQYTYPKEYEGKKIPDILFCGNHQVVEDYHRQQALKETIEKRPDLIEKMSYNRKDAQLIEDIKHHKNGIEKEEEIAVEKGKRFLK
jgi:tRNA (guanine37-N1)-methyltransferase